MKKELQATSTMVGILVVFGPPALAWIYWDLRAALAIFIGGQLIIVTAKLGKS